MSASLKLRTLTVSATLRKRVAFSGTVAFGFLDLERICSGVSDLGLDSGTRDDLAVSTGSFNSSIARAFATSGITS